MRGVVEFFQVEGFEHRLVLEVAQHLGWPVDPLSGVRLSTGREKESVLLSVA